MKSNYSKLLLLALLAIFTLGSCEKDDNDSDKIIVKLGAQDNTSIGAFYSVSENKVYTQAEALNNQAKIDLLCFYENTDTHQNMTTISSPGANITGIFTDDNGDEYFTSWTTKNTTYFTLPATDLTVEQFDQLKDGDTVIASYYDETVTSGNKKAKVLAVDDIYAFKTQGGIYGLFKVIELSNPESVAGWIKIEIKIASQSSI